MKFLILRRGNSERLSAPNEESKLWPSYYAIIIS